MVGPSGNVPQKTMAIIVDALWLRISQRAVSDAGCNWWLSQCSAIAEHGGPLGDPSGKITSLEINPDYPAIAWGVLRRCDDLDISKFPEIELLWS